MSNMSNVAPTFLFSISWNIFTCPLTFSLYVSLKLEYVSSRQHIHSFCFCIHSANLCHLVGILDSFTFKAIIDMQVLITIFSIVLGLFL